MLRACGPSRERGRGARNWYSEFRAWGWSWPGNRGARTKLAQRISCFNASVRGHAPSMWPQHRGGKDWHSEFREKCPWPERESCLGVVLAMEQGDALEIGTASSCSRSTEKKACTKLVQQIWCLGVFLAREKGGAREIALCGMLLRKRRVRTKLAQRISCLRVPPSHVGKARTRCFPRARSTPKHEIRYANFVHASSLVPGAPPSMKFAVPIRARFFPHARRTPETRNSLCQFRARPPFFGGHMLGALQGRSFFAGKMSFRNPQIRTLLCQFRACFFPHPRSTAETRNSLCQFRDSSLMPGTPPKHEIRCANFVRAPPPLPSRSLFAGKMIRCANFVHASSLILGAPPYTKFAVPISCAPPSSVATC